MKRTVYRFFFALLILLFAAAAEPVEFVCLISIDGARSDIFGVAGTPEMDRISSEGTVFNNVTTVYQSKTMPGHSSMLTGLSVGKHGVDDNKEMEPGQMIGVGTVFDIVHAAGLNSAAFLAKTKLVFLVNKENTDLFVVDAGAREVGDAVVRYLEEKQPNFLFVHFRDLDSAGHEYGWMSAEQVAAMGAVDSEIKRIIAAMKEEGMMEKGVVIVTSDHGGHSKTHGSRSKEDMSIPLVFFGEGIGKNIAVEREVSIIDIAPAIVRLLNLKSTYEMDGKEIPEITSVKEAVTAGN